MVELKKITMGAGILLVIFLLFLCLTHNFRAEKIIPSIMICSLISVSMTTLYNFINDKRLLFLSPTVTVNAVFKSKENVY